VSSGSPAAAVHLLIGDHIRTINGTKVIDWNHLVHLVRQAGTGATVEVGLERDSSEAVVQVTIGSRLDSPQ
jgi:S1-C subfamily serine protease